MTAESSRSKSFLLSGAALSCNLGAAAMAVASAGLLQKHVPGSRIVFLSTRYSHDRAARFDESQADWEIQRDSRTSFFGLFQLTRAIIWGCLFRVFKWDFKLLRSGEELSRYYDASALIDLSGDTLTEDYGLLVLFSHFIPIFIARCFDKPVVLLGQTIGPFPKSARFSRWVLRRSKHIVCRDPETLEFLKNLKVGDERLYSTIDTAFFLKPASESRADELEKQFGYSSKGDSDARPTIGFTMSRQFLDFAKKRDGTDRVMEHVVEALDRIVEQFDAQVVLFSHVNGPTDYLDDRIVARELKEQCRRQDRMFVADDELGPHEIKALIRRCTVFCGARMHSNIASLTSGVPTLAMAYSRKTRGIMTTVGMEAFVIEMEGLTADRLLEKLSELLSERDAISADLQSRVSSLKKSTESKISAIFEDILA